LFLPTHKAFRFRPVLWFYYNYSYSLDCTEARSVAVDLSGSIWVGYGYGSTFSSLVKITSGGSYIKYSDDLFGYNPIDDIEIDSQNNVWLATYQGSAKEISGNYLTTYDYSHFGTRDISSITIDKSGNIWFATHVGATVYKNDYTWENFTENNSGLVSNEVNAIAVDNDGNRWFGTNSGVSMYDGSKWKTYSRNNKLPSNYIFDISIDKDGNKFIESHSGLIKYDGIDWTNYGVSGCFAFEPNGNIWVGTGTVDGYSMVVYRFDGIDWYIVLAPTDKAIISTAVDTEGKKMVWDKRWRSLKF